MSYDKYIKYKTKYLDLKAHIHNEKLYNETQQIGGGDINNDSENDFIQTLGTTPNSDIFNNNINKLVGGSHDEQHNESYNLPEKLSPIELSTTNKIIETTQTKKKTHFDGERKLKKTKNVFSESNSELDSDFDDKNSSSLLSFSSVDSDSSSV